MIRVRLVLRHGRAFGGELYRTGVEIAQQCIERKCDLLPLLAASAPLGDAFQLLAQYPGQAEEGKKRHEAKPRGRVVHHFFRELAESITDRDDASGPQARGAE